jgi:uncharacterized protein (DUF433 family)
MLTNTLYKHIVVNDAGIPLIQGTRMKVVELVLDHKAYGWSPKELQANHPYLTLSQIYSALAYYWDHQEKIDQDIQRRLQRIDALQTMLKPSQMREWLQAEGFGESHEIRSMH